MSDHQNMGFDFERDPQSISRYLDHLESMLLLWRSEPTTITKRVLDESYFHSMLASFDRIWANIDEVILECSSEDLKERARGLRCEVTIDCDDLVTKRMEALDPLLDCVERMATRRVRAVAMASCDGGLGEMEIERETCVVCLEEFGVSGMDARVTECGHNFHFSCIFKWLQSCQCCPVCRFELCKT